MEPTLYVLGAAVAVLSLIVLVLTYKVGFNNGWHYCNKNATCLEIDGNTIEDIVLQMLASKCVPPPTPEAPHDP